MSKGKVLTFKYAEPFSRHYLCRVAVDNHNDMRHERGKNIRLDCRMYGSPTGGRSDSLRFYSMHRGNFFLCLTYFLKKDKEFRVYRLRLAYSLIHNELLGTRSDKDNLEVLRKKKRSIIWRQHLTKQRNGGGQIGIVVQNLDTSNISAVAINTKKK